LVLTVIDCKTKADIRELAQQINTIYKAFVHRRSGNVCDICGAGDTLAKHAVLRVRSDVHGYKDRPFDAPKLCHRHASGWAHSHNAYNFDGTKTAEQIDLHFAHFLAKQLLKEKAK
jgi:hypothetical protein